MGRGGDREEGVQHRGCLEDAGPGLSRGGRNVGGGRKAGRRGDTRARLPPTYPAGRRPHRAAAGSSRPLPRCGARGAAPLSRGCGTPPARRILPPVSGGLRGSGVPGGGGVPRPSALFREQRVQPIRARHGGDVTMMSFSRENQAWRGCPSEPAPPQHGAETALYQRGLFACK